MMKRLLYCLCVLLFVGCGTPYQKQGFRGGFSEAQLDRQMFRVTFRGNAYTNRERASDFTLLRSAEVALAHGFQYFIIVDSDHYTRTSSYTTPTTTNTRMNAYGFGNYAYGTATSTTTGGQTFFHSKPNVTNTIVCFQERPQVEGVVYDASFLVQSLKGQYDIQQ